MSYFRSYFEKNNTILKDLYVNTPIYKIKSIMVTLLLLLVQPIHYTLQIVYLETKHLKVHIEVQVGKEQHLSI